METILSLVLPYIHNEHSWILLCARTSKALSLHLDLVERHWGVRYAQLVAELRSGRARFEIKRYVRCGSTDPFRWECGSELDACFTVSVDESVQRSYARQAVPQVKQAVALMSRWQAASDAHVFYTAKKKKPYLLPPPRACRATHRIGCIPLCLAPATPVPLLSGDLEALQERVRRAQVGEVGGIKEEGLWEWECECGEWCNSAPKGRL